MSVLKWDQTSEKLYETGIDRTVLYIQNNDGTYATGVAWNGVTNATESPSGAESNPIYANNNKYIDIRSAEEFGATIQAYTYPDEWMLCDGSAPISENAPFVMAGQQARRSFGLTYRTLVGNDVLLNDFSYKIHLIYSATAAPSEREYQTVNDSPEAIQFSWELTTTPIEVTGLKQTALITIDVSKVAAMDDGADKTAKMAQIKQLEDMLYGTASSDPKLPLPSDLATIFGGGGDDSESGASESGANV